MKKFRFILTLLLTLVLSISAFTFAGCNKDDGDDGGSSAPPPVDSTPEQVVDELESVTGYSSTPMMFTASMTMAQNGHSETVSAQLKIDTGSGKVNFDEENGKYDLSEVNAKIDMAVKLGETVNSVYLRFIDDSGVSYTSVSDGKYIKASPEGSISDFINQIADGRTPEEMLLDVLVQGESMNMASLMIIAIIASQGAGEILPPESNLGSLGISFDRIANHASIKTDLSGVTITFDLIDYYTEIMDEAIAVMQSVTADTTLNELYANQTVKNILQNDLAGLPVADALTILKTLFSGSQFEAWAEQHLPQPTEDESLYEWIGRLLATDMSTDQDGGMTGTLGEQKLGINEQARLDAISSVSELKSLIADYTAELYLKISMTKVAEIGMTVKIPADESSGVAETVISAKVAIAQIMTADFADVSKLELVQSK